MGKRNGWESGTDRIGPNENAPTMPTHFVSVNPVWSCFSNVLISTIKKGPRMVPVAAVGG